MKKIFLLFLGLLFLSGCSGILVNANMYKIKYWEWVKPVDVKSSMWEGYLDYSYEIINTFDAYSQSLTKSQLLKYDEEFFKEHTIIIVCLIDSTTGNRHSLQDVKKKGSTLEVAISYKEVYDLGQAFSATLYCIEIETKDYKRIVVNREFRL